MSAARVTDIQVTRTATAYRGATEAHERVNRLDTELHAAFAALRKADERMREEGAQVTVQMSAPLQAAYSTWRTGNASVDAVTPE